MTKWQRKAEAVRTSQRSSAKKKREDLSAFDAKLYALGAESWELVPYGAAPMTGTFTNNIGYGYLSLFRRPGS